MSDTPIDRDAASPESPPVFTPPPFGDSIAGTVIADRYRVHRRLARGGMATVYAATDERLDRPVAVKVMHPHLAEDHQFIARFDREARSAARINHPAVVTVFDQGFVDGRPFLVMDLVSGPNLRQLLQREGALSLGEALRYTHDILLALRAASRENVIHRDIKPENVLIPAEGPCRVADFGLARAATEGAMSMTSNMLGTVTYMAPEIATSHAADARTDLYSVGIMLYEMLTGRPPWQGGNPMFIAYAHVHQDVPSPSMVEPWIPSEVDVFVAALTARDPDERPSTAHDAVTMLNRLLADLSDELLEQRSPQARPALDPTADTPTDTSLCQDDSEELAADAPAVGDVATGEDAADTHGADADTEEAEDSLGGTRASRPADEMPTELLGEALRGARQYGHGDTESSASAHATDSGDTDEVSGWEETASMPTPVFSALHETATLPKVGDSPTDEAPAASPAAGAASAGPSASGSKLPPVVPPSSVRLRGAAPVEAKDEVEADESDVEPRRRRRVGLWVTLLSLFAFIAAAAYGAYWWWTEHGPGSYLPMPATVSRPFQDVTSDLATLGLKVEVVEEFSDEVDKGLVIASNPQSQGNVQKYATVRLTVSKGVDLRTVPDVRGKNAEQATTELQTVGLKLGQVNEEWSEEVASGLIISQSAEPNSQLRVESTVGVVVSKGRQPFPVPKLSGITLDEAKAALAELPFTIETSEEFSDSVPAGTVISQEPAEGTQLHRGDVVRMVVSKGPELIAVPSVMGLGKDEATARLRDAGFVVTTSNLAGGIFGLAHSTDPAAGTAIPKGSTVTLYLV